MATLTLYKSGIDKYKAKRTPAQQKEFTNFIQPQLVLFFKNVLFLLKKKGMSQQAFKRYMVQRYSFGVNPPSIKRFIDGKYTTANIYYLSAFCIGLKEPLHRLLSTDYQAEEEARQGLNKPLLPEKRYE